MNWEVLETDPAEDDRNRALLFVLRLRGQDYATRWHEGLLTAIMNLAEFPGPRAWPRAESEEERRRAECRVMLYTGPDKRPAPSVSYRVIYTLLEPIQRIRHALRGHEQREDADT